MSNLVGLSVHQVGQRGARDLAGTRLRQGFDEEHFPEGGHGPDALSHKSHHLTGNLFLFFLHA